MRGTLHFVTPADAKWMIGLLAPRVIARNAARLKKEVDVDARVVARSREVVARALEGGKRLERTAIYDALESQRIRTGKSRGLHILLRLALDGTLCLAGREGKQHTFALLEEWIPKTRHLERDEALAELAHRYFTSHGPATIQDLMWWAGITAKDAGIAVNGTRRRLACEVVDGRTYWMAPSHPAAGLAAVERVRLLPAYDEYTVAYRDRSLLVAAGDGQTKAGLGLLNSVVLVDGRIVGTWKRTIAKASVHIETTLNRALKRAELSALRAEVDRYEEFLGLDRPATSS
jgi:hypothetical protein